MKKVILSLVALATVSFSTASFAQYTNGYYRGNGTYVNGYMHSPRDGNPYNNYSYGR